ncbi:MAG: hypothetical protein ACK4M9_10815 [Anaerobacillus sp.]|uniref:hypothetical protein n=1 Tax=Anaerobacillus sp. TaxID=1872506 RepID=UPI003919AE6A
MEQLLEFLFSNPFFLIIIIGAIASYLKRGKEQETQETRKTSRPPLKEEQQRNEVDWREIFRQEDETTPTPVRDRERYSTTATKQQTISIEANRSNELLEHYEKAKRKKEVKKRNELVTKNSPIYKDDLTVTNKINLNFANVTSEEAVKGVIWSEVLGKPRSKGSYRPSLNTRRKQG